MHRSGLSDQCTLMWETPPTVFCSSLRQFNVLLTQPDGTLVYSGSFGQSTTTTETTPLNPNTVYRATITAWNTCGNTTCSANCSPVLIESKNAAGLLVAYHCGMSLYLTYIVVVSSVLCESLGIRVITPFFI